MTIMEQIEHIQKLAEQLEKDTAVMTKDMFSFDNVARMCMSFGQIDRTADKLDLEREQDIKDLKEATLLGN